MMADEFDELFAPQAPGRIGGDEFDALFSQPRQTAPAELRIDDAVGRSPDEAAKLLGASRTLGEPFGLNADNPAPAIARAKALNAKSVVVRNPFVQDYVENNPAAAQVSGDDWDQLDVFSKAWGVLTDPDGTGKLATLLGASALNTGAKKGVAAERQGLARIAGDVEGAKKFEDYIKALPQYAGGVPYYADLVGQMVGQLGLDLGTGGAVGGAAGSVVPIVGTAFGALGGTAAVAGNAAMGRFLMKLDEQAAAAGVLLDPTARLAATAMMGALATGANMIGVKSGGAAVADLVAEAGVQAVARPGVAAALGRMTANAGKGAGVGAGLMGTMAAADAVLEDAVKAASPGDLPTLFADPVRRAEVIANVATAIADGAVLMGGLHALPAGRNFVNDLQLSREAAAGKEGLQALMDSRETSATWARAPEALQDFAARHGDESLTVTGEGAGLVPEGLGQRQPDGAVVIPLADYAALVEMDLHRRLADDIQHTSDGLSVNEAKGLSDKWNKLEFQHDITDLGDGRLRISLKNSVQDVDGTPSGITYAKSPAGLEIMDVGLAESDRGQGKGLALYKVLLGEAQKEGLPVLSDVSVAPDAVKIYEKLKAEGYTVIEGGEITPDGSRRQNDTGTRPFIIEPQSRETPVTQSVSDTPMVLTDPTTQTAVAAMDQMYLAPLFPEPAAVGMTAPEFARYNKLLEARAEAIKARSERKAARAAAVEQTPTYRARESEVREYVERNVDDRPVMVAERMARTGDPGDGSGLASFKLDREVVDAVSRPGTAGLLSGLVKKGGLHPDELAGMTGFGSGAELVQALVAMRVERDRLGLSPAAYREKVIREGVAERMAEDFGDLAENIQREAAEAAVMPATTEILNAEREFLAAKAGAEVGASLADMRVGVATDFATSPAKRARDLKGFMKAAGRAGREAELALLRQDFAKAFDAKQRQQLSHLYAEQAKAFVRMERKAGNILRMYSENVKLDAVSQRYTDQVQGIAQALGISLRRDTRDLAEVFAGREGQLLAFIDARNADLGGLIPDSPLPQKPYAQFTVEDTTRLHDLLVALDFQGRAEKKLTVAGQKRDLADTVTQAAAQIKALPDRFDPNKSGLGAFLAKLGRRIDAPLLKMEQLFEWFDHHDTEGVFHQVVVKPLHQAQSLRDDMFVSIGKQLRALDPGRAWTKRLADEVPNMTLMDPFLDTPTAMRFTRKNLLALMLNMGNPGNFEVMVKGYGWEAQAVRDFVTAHATREDWKWVQGIWDTFKSLEPHVKATYRELAGVAPEMVTPNKVFTQFGTAEGGYFPLIKDVLRAETKGDGLAESLFNRGQIQPMPANGYTKSRTGATYPLDLNPDLIPAYLRATAHDIAFRGAVIEANKFLSHSEVQKAVKQTFGPEYAAQFHSYLQDIANDGVSDVGGISYLNRAVAGARNATIASLIGLNPGTVAIHGMSAGFNSIGELAHQFGWKNAIRSTPKFVRTALSEVAQDAYNVTVGRITKSPAAFNKAWAEAMEQSGEMRNRLHNFDRDLNMMQDRALGKRDRIAAWNNFATGFVAYGDLITAVPTFITARDLALANGRTLEEAIAIGNKTVRQAHGSAGIVDRAKIQRGGEFQKTFTMFYGYFSHNYNRNRNTWREAMEGKRQLTDREFKELGTTALKVTTAGVFYALLPAINHAWIRHPRDEHDSYAKWMAGALLTQFSGTIPGVRDLGTSIVTGLDPVLTPLAASAKSIAITARNALVLTGLREDKIKHGAITDAVNTAGILTGAGIRQVGKAAQFLYDVKENKEHPQGFWEWWRGLTSGHAKERKHH